MFVTSSHTSAHAKLQYEFKYHNTTINQKSNIHMVVTSSHTSAHAKLQYESKYHNTTINKKFLLISNHCNECKKNSSTNQRSNPMCCSKQERQTYLTTCCRSTREGSSLQFETIVLPKRKGNVLSSSLHFHITSVSSYI